MTKKNVKIIASAALISVLAVPFASFGFSSDAKAVTTDPCVTEISMACEHLESIGDIELDVDDMQGDAKQIGLFSSFVKFLQLL